MKTPNTLFKWISAFLLFILVPFGFPAMQKQLPPYKILFGLQEKDCLPWSVFFWQKAGTVTFQRHDLVLFPARNMKPYFKEDMTVIKMAAGMPGDRVKIKDGKVFINGNFITDVRDGARAFRQPMNHWDIEYVLGPDQVFMLGTEPRSYDSRYWGPYPKHLVRGRVSVLF